MGKNKRKRGDDAFKNAYQGVTITPRPSSGRPATPHSFFKHSYDVEVNNQENKQIEDSQQSTCNGRVVVHQHANGLCIVTIGDLNDQKIKSIDYQVKESPSNLSANERRKRQSKLLRGGTVEDSQGITSPNTILARVTLDSDEIVNIPAGVWGSIMELNSNITPELLMQDPLLDGYLAIILPTGSFPPKFRHKGSDDTNGDQDDEGDAQKKARGSGDEEQD